MTSCLDCKFARQIVNAERIDLCGCILREISETKSPKGTHLPNTRYRGYVRPGNRVGDHSENVAIIHTDVVPTTHKCVHWEAWS